MDDFIFGTLSTDALRIQRVQNRLRGVTHTSHTPLDPKPGEEITFYLSIGPDQPADQAWVYWTTDQTDPEGKMGEAEHGFATEMKGTGSKWELGIWGFTRTFEATLPAQKPGTVLRYRLSGTSICQGEVFADYGAYYALYIDLDEPPEWSKEAVLYQIFSDRFSPGKNKPWLQTNNLDALFGGTLNGVTDHLDYLENLGITVIWFTPIFPSETYHRYDTTDVYNIDPRMGTKEDFKKLLDQAHKRGIRMLLDLVPNHWSHKHPTFLDALQNPNSKYRDWYTFKHWPNDYECFFGSRHMPKINLRNPEVRKYIIDSAVYWLKIGVDGFRVDYAIGPTPDFWADLRKATRQAKKDSWIFGESVDDADTLLSFEGVMDGSLDFPLLEGFRNAFGFAKWNACQLARYVDDMERFYPDDFQRISFFDNHDMNRFSWIAKNDWNRLRLVALCQFTLKYPPILYYGTEVGMTQRRDALQAGRKLDSEARLPMLWGDAQNKPLLDYFQNLISFRKENPQIWKGERKTLYSDADFWVYEISWKKNKLIVSLNLSTSEKTLSYELLNKDILFTSHGGEIRNQNGKWVLPPLSGFVIKG
jgi:glycosidase